MATIRRRRRVTGDTFLVDYKDAASVRRRLTAPTEEAAQVLLGEKIKASRQAAPPAEDPNITFKDYAERWLVEVAGDVEEATLRSYRENIERHLLPVFGTWMVRKLHRGHVKHLLAGKRAAGLSKNSVRLIRATLSVMLGDALEGGLLSVNPALGIARRGRRAWDAMSQAERQKAIVPLSVEALAAFLTAAAARCSRETATLFLLLADSGTRPGEGCALQWEDVDPTARRLRIERSVDNHGRVKPTKTASVRLVDMSRRLAAALGELHAAREVEAMTSGRAASPWVFATRAGGPVTPKRAGRVFRQVLAAAGLGRHRLYDLRHTYASHLLAENAPITYVAAQLGHAKPTTTLWHYAHYLPRGDQAFIDRLEAVRCAAHVAAPAPAPPAVPEAARAGEDGDRSAPKGGGYAPMG